MRRSIALLTALAFACLFTGNARAGRVALVIGNAHYDHLPSLASPANNARAVTQELRRLGYRVLLGTDLARAEMLTLTREMTASVGAQDIALFHYSGHAVQVDGENYLVPVDAEAGDADELAQSSVALRTALDALVQHAGTTLAFIDASGGTPLAGPSGLAKVRPGSGSLVAFSAAPGEVASDGAGSGPLSPFTEALLRHMGDPRLDVHQMMREVRSDVMHATGERQVPWEASSLIGDVFVARPDTAVTIGLEEKEFWESVSSPAAAESERAFVGRAPELWDSAATRMFTGPHEFPPEGFGAYGIVVFPSAPTPSTRPRFELVCNAFVSTFDQSRDSSVPQHMQMVTVWPVRTDVMAAELNATASSEQCPRAVGAYDAFTARQARRNAERAGRHVSSHGPFLFAWAPSDEAGRSDVLVLVLDMSDVTTEVQAQQVFDFWKQEIEQKGFIWRNGWNFELIRLRMKFKADAVGRIFFDGGG